MNTISEREDELYEAIPLEEPFLNLAISVSPIFLSVYQRPWVLPRKSAEEWLRELSSVRFR